MKNKKYIYFILFLLLALNTNGQQKRLILINLQSNDSIIIKDSTRVTLDIDGKAKGKMIILSDNSIKINNTILKLEDIKEIGVKTDERKTIGYSLFCLGVGGCAYGAFYYNSTPRSSGSGLIPIGNDIGIFFSTVIIEFVSIVATSAGLLIANNYKHYKTINHNDYLPEKNFKFYRIIIQTIKY